jgi:hypothetical protein
MGYLGDGTGNCSEFDWQNTGMNWTARPGYWINVTEHNDVCRQELYYVNPGDIPSWFCSSFGACQSPGRASCLNITDLNNLNQTFIGNISDYDATCIYKAGGGGGSGGFPETVVQVPVQSPTTFSLFNMGPTNNPVDSIITWIKNFLKSIGVKI